MDWAHQKWMQRWSHWTFLTAKSWISDSHVVISAFLSAITPEQRPIKGSGEKWGWMRFRTGRFSVNYHNLIEPLWIPIFGNLRNRIEHRNEWIYVEGVGSNRRLFHLIKYGGRWNYHINQIPEDNAIVALPLPWHAHFLIYHLLFLLFLRFLVLVL